MASACSYFSADKVHYWMFHQPGLQEIGFQAEKSWSRVYGSPPYHTTKIGLYLQPEMIQQEQMFMTLES
ncbi:MAG: hypothetical protein Ct9H300mP9_8060 [Candidatus Neomarinimicrobiota bacterium]|nr:MAG: hypothetical protein Ct9H300mP9_8060 [Candidatus Neomarinimicrobiota bacterium]